ncbi:luciferase family oxidoreductase group 1 [Evansella vedderi]|uniref:Luciferase family oxidoreductase group 1 n=1 Tax=Evansella vedderi TaxID=38282 RepID=A0ABU0A265_9BACI|nr:LLM class flavin-dependent oxidoreductase [Evansella vedderi]MDQ0257051.1 luciferase family oxidoreductase group 1 [Evansella vedderi]
MKLSILDQSPISPGKTAQQALNESLKLAQAGEALGYTRFWIAEHHSMDDLACPAPEVMLGYIGGQTNTIRIGAGAVLLPHYSPYRVAETYNLLATLFPGRVDLGIGRAPGGSAEATIALSGNFLEKVRHLPESLKTLIKFIHHDFSHEEMFSKIKPTPVPETAPKLWLLGTSEKSAKLAAENGIAYAFGQFMSESDGRAILQTYLENFQGRMSKEKPEAILAVSVLCGETTDAAEKLAWRSYLRKKQLPKDNEIEYDQLHKDEFAAMKKSMVIGNPQEVVKSLRSMKENYGADEIMIITITDSFESRLRSYELIAKEIGKGPLSPPECYW